LTEHTIGWAIDNGYEFYDFGVGDEAYKLNYADRSVPLSGAVLPITAIGHAYAAAIRGLTGLRATRLWQSARPLKWKLKRAFRSEKPSIPASDE
jgi:CelD/BcsL family acetyltransferase involved in cellulose biosynthesis